MASIPQFPCANTARCVASSITNGHASVSLRGGGECRAVKGIDGEKCLELEPAGQKAVHFTVALASEMKGTPDACVRSPSTCLPDLK